MMMSLPEDEPEAERDPNAARIPVTVNAMPRIIPAAKPS
jgi:hypothetical protein